MAEKPEGVRLGQYLIGIGRLGDPQLYEALSLQQGLPLADPDVRQLSFRVARALPEHVARRWRVVPFQIAEGQLYVAGPDAPPVEMNESLREFTALEIRFHLVTPAKFEEMTNALL
jgi:type IV pilus assembly protein PilB